MSLRTLEKAVNRTADRTVGDIVATYGSNVQRLKMDAAAGKIDPTTALMAMMTIQRIVAANTQPPSGSTVAQDVGMAPPPQPMGMSAMAPQAAPQQPPTRMAYGGQVAVSNNQVPSPAMERGISGLPVPDNMFDYADGGMVAFAGGGDVQRFQNQGAVRLNPTFPSSGLSYGYGMNPTGLDAVRMPFTGDYRIPGAVSSPAGTPSILQDPLARVNPTGYKQFAEQVKKLAPHLAEVELEQLYNRTAGSVGKAVNILKSLGPAAGIAGASMAVEQATGLSPEEQTLKGIGAVNPILGGITAALKRFGLTTPKEAKGSPLVEGRPRGQANEDTTFVPPPQPPAPPSQEDIRKQEDARVNAAVSEARKLMGDVPRLQAPKAPDRLTVPERADLATEMEAARGIAGSMFAMPADADKTLDQILKSDRETLAKQGYDFDLIKNMVAETRAEREKIPAQRKEAANLRLLEAGLAIMGGTSPFAFVNIGKGASEAAKGFNEDMKEFRKLDREYRKELQQLQSMQNQETLMLTTEGKRKYERIQDRVEQTKDKRANAMYQIGQNMVNQVSRERETAQTLNSAIDRTVYQTQAELAKAEAQMKNQMGIASAQIAAQERAAGKPAAEVQAVRAYAESSGKPYHEAYREMMQARQEPKTRAQLEKEFMENIILQRQYGTFENFMKSQTGGGSTPESLYKKYGLEPK
jgi:hypothetical protein